MTGCLFVGRSAEAAQLAKFAGRTALVEVNGVFPPSDHQLLDYVATLVEVELVRNGVIVLPRTIAPPGTTVMMPAKSEEKKPNVRAVVSLDWSGIDYTTTQRLQGGKLAGMIVVGIFTFGLGAIIIGLVSPSYFHELKLDSRVKLSLRMFPQVPGLVAASGSGERAMQLIVDPESNEGHMTEFKADRPD